MKYQVRWPRISLLSAAGLLVLLWAFAAAAQVKVTTVVGGFINDGKPGTSSALQDPTDVAMDSTGNLYITDNIDQRIRKLSTTGILTTIAGTGISGYGGDGGLAINAKISFPRGIVVDSKGNIISAIRSTTAFGKSAPRESSGRLRVPASPDTAVMAGRRPRRE